MENFLQRRIYFRVIRNSLLIRCLTKCFQNDSRLLDEENFYPEIFLMIRMETVKFLKRCLTKRLNRKLSFSKIILNSNSPLIPTWEILRVFHTKYILDKEKKSFYIF